MTMLRIAAFIIAAAFTASAAQAEIKIEWVEYSPRRRQAERLSGV